MADYQLDSSRCRWPARGKVNYHRVIGAVLLYLNINIDVFFVALYGFAALLVHNAFTSLGPLEDNLTVAGNLIYFSFVTLTSVGYGDIVPLHPVVRGIANVEAIVGQLYPAALLARLRYVSLLTENSSVIQLCADTLM